MLDVSPKLQQDTCHRDGLSGSLKNLYVKHVTYPTVLFFLRNGSTLILDIVMFTVSALCLTTAMLNE